MAIKLIRSILVKLGFMRHPTVMALQPKLAFYIDAAAHGSHGQIVVTNHAYNLKEQAVNFSFIGRREPPAMSLEVITELWKQAAEQGYYPIRIESYGVPTPPDRLTWNQLDAAVGRPQAYPPSRFQPDPSLQPSFNRQSPLIDGYGIAPYPGVDALFPRPDANFRVSAQAAEETEPAPQAAGPADDSIAASPLREEKEDQAPVDPAVFRTNRETVSD